MLYRYILGIDFEYSSSGMGIGKEKMVSERLYPKGCVTANVRLYGKQ